MDSVTSVYPQGVDSSLGVPLHPGETMLSQAQAEQDVNVPAASSKLTHVESHKALSSAVQAIESAVAPDDSKTSRDHSDPWNVDYSQAPYSTTPSLKKGRQLRVQNTHVWSDTNETPTESESVSPDSTAQAIHHSVSVSPSSVGEFQAVGGGAWNSLGLNTVPSGWFNSVPGASLAGVLSEVQQQALQALTASQSGTGLTSGLAAQLNTLLASYAAYMASQSHMVDVVFLPTGSIFQDSAENSPHSNIQFSLSTGVCALSAHSFSSNLSADQSNVMIFQQQPQADGSYWRPSSMVGFWNAGTMIGYSDSYQPQVGAGKDYTAQKDFYWRTDGNIYISLLGYNNEFTVCTNPTVFLPEGVSLVHYAADGTVIGSVSADPFINPGLTAGASSNSNQAYLRGVRVA